MTTITKLLEEYHNGSADACEEILKRMMPLAKKYAGKIHCMDYEDALQELCLTILEALTHLDPACPEGKCISYIETSVINRYYALCKRYLSAPETENRKHRRYQCRSSRFFFLRRFPSRHRALHPEHSGSRRKAQNPLPVFLRGSQRQRNRRTDANVAAVCESHPPSVDTGIL